MRILGIDYGERRIGIAMSDPLCIIAGALETYVRKDIQADIAHISGIIKENEIKTVVIGLPKNMDGTEGESAVKAREFGQRLSESGAEIVFKDERLSSVSANRVLDEAGVHWKKRSAIVDTMAAQIILQGYLDRIR